MTEAVRPDGGAITRGFLFADLRGYTAYVEAHGDAAASALLDVYRRLVRDIVARHDGAEIKTEGDSFYVVFPSASGAVLCGLDIAAGAVAHSLADADHPIRVGIGVHAGESVAAAEGYVGSAVNIAARVCSQAKAGEVLVTDTVRGLTRTSGRLTFTAVGRRTLKGIAEPIALYRAELTGTALVAAPGGGGPIWRRPAVLAGIGGLIVLVLAVLAVKGGFGPAASSPSASAAPSLPPAVAERIAYTQVRLSDPNNPAKCDFLSEGRAFLVDEAGGDPVRITHGGDASETHVAWSPDGSKMAFVGFSQDYGFGIYLLNVATGKTSQLLPDTPPAGLGHDRYTYIGSVSWSRDGTSLVFSSAGGPKIWEIGADGAGLKELDISMPPNPVPTSSAEAEPFFQPLSPVSLPDGRIAALLQRNDVYTNTVAIAPAGGGELSPVEWIQAGLNVTWMAWSPDGSRVAFVGADVTQAAANEWDLYVANADGSSVNKVTSAHGAESGPAWSPDGTRIVYGGSGTLYIVDAASGTPRELPGTVDREACWPSWGRTTTAVLPQPTPTLAPGATPPLSAFHDGLLDPGVYLTEVFQPRMRFEVGPGWEGIRNYLDYLVLGPIDIQGAEIDVAKVQVGLLTSCFDSPTRVLKDPSELVAFLQAHANLDVSGVSPINILGESGLSVEVSVSALPTEADCPGQPEFPPQIPIVLTGSDDGYAVDAAERVKVIALPTRGGGLLAFFLEAPKDQYDQFLLRAQQILDTLTFP